MASPSGSGEEAGRGLEEGTRRARRPPPPRLTSGCARDGWSTQSWIAAGDRQEGGSETRSAPVPRSRPRSAWGLTSIQEHQGSQHQERGRLPHKLVEHTPEGGAHCQGESELILQAEVGRCPQPHPTWTGHPFLVLRSLFCSRSYWRWPPYSTSSGVKCPGYCLPAAPRLGHGQETRRVTPK